jgi:hypothetical protein
MNSAAGSESGMSLDPMGPPGSAVELLNVLGCPVCQAEPAIDAEAVTWFCRQAFDDPDSRGRVLAAGGLCPRHWWQVATEEESSRATMLGTAELLAVILERDGQPAVRPASCPICADIQASLAHRFYLLLADLGRARLEAAPPGWQPCLPHLRAVADLRLERWLTQWVAAREERELAQALAAARRYVRTRQHRYRAEAIGTEADELRAALATLLGARGERGGRPGRSV